ncbi:MAG: branched-chain amino acid ABC transporter permease [Rhodospirillaceae bacterium]|nr:branched-chain amino acid ABC transporter permease [Rhodospirillaceae bacterium]
MDFLNGITLIANYIIIPGLTYGSQLALGALGITIIYSVLRFSNFAHGEFMSFGAMSAILLSWLFISLGITLHPIPTAIIVLPIAIVLTISYCLIVDKLIFKFYRKQNSKSVINLIVSIGVMFFTGGLIRFIVGPGDKNFFDGERFILKARTFKNITGLNEGLTLKTTQGITISLSVLLVVLLFWFLNKTKTGKSMRAYSDNKELALLSGINPEKVVLITWIITGTLACVAGTLYGLDKSYKPFTYLHLVLPIFSAAIVGGVGNPVGAIIGGFVIAFSELIVTFAYKKIFFYFLPYNYAPEGLLQILSTDYKIAISFLILVLVLLIKPTGIYKGKII